MIYESISIVLIAILLGREWHYRSKLGEHAKTIESLREDLKAMRTIDLDTQLESLGSVACSAWNVSWEFLASLHFGWISYVVVCFLVCCVMVYELRYVHPSTSTGMEKRFKVFVQRRTPYAAIIFHVFLFLWGSLAYWKVISPRLFLTHCIDILVCWYLICNPIANIVHNGVRIYFHYLPQGDDDWKAKLKDYNWWFWVLSRIVGTDDVLSLLNAIGIWIAAAYFLWPFRYYAQYGLSNCSQAAWMMHKAMAEGEEAVCSFPATVDPEWSDFSSGYSHPHTSSTEVFVISMILHANILMIWTQLARCWVFGTPSPAFVQTHHPFTYRIFNSLRQSEMAQGLLVLAVIANGLLCLFRIVWFLWRTSCLTWYGYLVTWIFSHLQIYVILTSLSLILVLRDKNRMRSYSKAAVVRKLVLQFRTNQDLQADSDESEEDITSPVEDPINKEAEKRFVEHLYEALLDRAVRLYCFHGANALDEENEDRNESKEENHQRSLQELFLKLIRQFSTSLESADVIPPAENSTAETRKE